MQISFLATFLHMLLFFLTSYTTLLLVKNTCLRERCMCERERERWGPEAKCRLLKLYALAIIVLVNIHILSMTRQLEL